MSGSLIIILVGGYLFMLMLPALVLPVTIRARDWNLTKRPGDTIFVFGVFYLAFFALFVFGGVPLLLWLFSTKVNPDIPFRFLQWLSLVGGAFGIALGVDNIRNDCKEIATMRSKARHEAARRAEEEKRVRMRERHDIAVDQFKNGFKERSKPQAPLLVQFLQRLALRIAMIGACAVIALIFGTDGKVVLWSTSLAGITASILLIVDSV